VSRDRRDRPELDADGVPWPSDPPPPEEASMPPPSTPPAEHDPPPAGELRPSARWVLAALRAGGPMQTVKQLGDRTAAEGHQLKERTIQVALNALAKAGLAVGDGDGDGPPRYWSPADHDQPPATTGDDTSA
jgi:hypothetical protein